jgi:hypothetical protein
MKHNNTYLGKCVYVFCDNEAEYICDQCDDEFCNDHMRNDHYCKECQ